MKIFERYTEVYRRYHDRNVDLGVEVFITFPSRYRTVRFADDDGTNTLSKYLLFPRTCFKIDAYRNPDGFHFHGLSFGFMKGDNSKAVHGSSEIPHGNICMTRFYPRHGRNERYLKPLIENAISYFWSSAFGGYDVTKWQRTKDVKELIACIEVFRIPPDSQQIRPRKWVNK